MSKHWVPVITLQSMPENEIIPFSWQGNDWILIRQGHEVSAFVDVCSHQDVKLSEFGEIQEGLLICHAHGAVFSCQTGQPLCFPASSSLHNIPVRDNQGMIEIEIESKP